MLLSPPCWQVSTFFAEAISIITWILPVWRPGPGNSKLCLKLHSELLGKAGGTASHHLQVVRTLCILPERIYFFSRVLQASKISPAHQPGAFSRDSGFISPTCWVPCLFPCQLYSLATALSCLFSIHPTEVSISRNHASSHPHPSKLIKPGSSSTPSYIMLFIFLTILIALVNHAFHFKAITSDPRWPNYAAPASVDVYTPQSAGNNSPNPSWLSRAFEFFCHVDSLCARLRVFILSLLCHSSRKAFNSKYLMAAGIPITLLSLYDFAPCTVELTQFQMPPV